ncbi:MAG: hypothetical protein AAF193_10460 [Bacteroidota bacterium]
MKRILILLAFMTAGIAVSAQCDTIATFCEHNLSQEYISDGQFYRALLYNDQVAEFETTFFGGSTYRIAACSGTEDGNLIFKIYDNEGNLLFSNSEYSNAPYWDFVVESTMQCKIEAKLDSNRQTSGCAVLLIGFKQ